MIAKIVEGVGHVALQVPHLEQGLWFFRDVLGFRQKFTFEYDGFQVVMLNAGKIEIEMWAGKDEEGRSPSETDFGVHHLAILVKNLDEVVAEMESLGVEILAPIYIPTRGLREVIVNGPGGLRVQFVEQDIPVLIWRSITGDFKTEG